MVLIKSMNYSGVNISLLLVNGYLLLIDKIL